MNIYGKAFESRLLLGTARYPSPEILKKAILLSQAEILTVSLRRQNPSSRSGEAFWSLLRELNRVILPNTAGCRTAREAITTAHLARELFNTDLIKLEVIGDEATLAPDPFGLLEAATVLLSEGFKVLPYSTHDVVLVERLIAAGCQVVMPWGSPIGSGRGLENKNALKNLRLRFPKTTLIIDAGIGAPSHAAEAMEMGFDGVLLNTAVATAQDPESMALSFAQAIAAGHTAFRAGLMGVFENATPSTPTLGLPFWGEK